ncbi:MAG: 2TM domain-containing protein, partial [Polaribacter sp.]
MERIDNSKSNFTEAHKYLLAKKRVEKIKGFYIHLAVYIVVNIFISAIIIYGLTNDSDGEYGFAGAITHFGTYSTWLFWGIGLFFH